MKDSKLLVDFKIYLRQKKEYFKKLFQLSKQHKSCINNEELERVNDVFEKKDKIIKKIKKIDSDNLKLIEDIKELYSLRDKGWLSKLAQKDDLNQNLKIKINKLVEIIKKYTKSEKENKQLLEEWYNNMGVELGKINKGIKTNKFYNKKDRIYSTFIDKKS